MTDSIYLAVLEKILFELAVDRIQVKHVIIVFISMNILYLLQTVGITDIHYNINIYRLI